VGLVRLAGENSWLLEDWRHRYRTWRSVRAGLPAVAARPRRGRHRGTGIRILPSHVAVLVAAHNEALVINETIRAASRLVPRRNIHVVSDMSTDNTAQLARAAGVKVLELEPNRGKAGALAAGIAHFDLCRRFKVVMLLDADTRPTEDYLRTGLPLFADPTVVAVAGRAKSIMDPPSPTAMGRFLVAYRERLYIVVQLLLKYGQAARGANVVSIVPGFASMYRTSALQDYMKQVRRWILGFWQTVRRHRKQTGRFWLVLATYIFELLMSCVFFVLLLPVFLVSMFAAVQVTAFGSDWDVAVFLSGLLRPQDVLFGVLLPDFLLTILAAVSLRKPGMLLMAPLFPLMRILDAFLCLQVLPKAFSSASTGAWVSPARRVQGKELTPVTAGSGAS